MIKIAVCDDEAYMAKEIAGMAAEYFDSRKLAVNISTYEDGASLLESTRSFDIVFLDIRMQRPDGMQTAAALRNSNWRGILVFITVLKEHVFDSFELQAFDYLLKPPDRQRFIRTMDRALSTPGLCEIARLVIRRAGECVIVPFDDILYCEIINRKAYVHTRSATIDYYDKMESLSQKLDRRFYRCHRSYLVNLHHVCPADGKPGFSRRLVRALLCRIFLTPSFSI